MLLQSGKTPEEETRLSGAAVTGRARQSHLLLPVGLAQSFSCWDPLHPVALVVGSGCVHVPGMAQPAGCHPNAAAHQHTIKLPMSCRNYPGPSSHPETNASDLHLRLQAGLIA